MRLMKLFLFISLLLAINCVIMRNHLSETVNRRINKMIIKLLIIQRIRFNIILKNGDKNIIRDPGSGLLIFRLDNVSIHQMGHHY
jgi:hypothetical protein